MEPHPDIAGHISPGLARLMQAVIDDPERTQDAVLGVVLEYARGGLIDTLVRRGRLERVEASSLLAELEGLISRYGADAAVVGFLRYRASPDLAALIAAFLDARGGERPPTLGLLREAVDEGLMAPLDGDEHATLLAELERLIALHGPDSLAEQLA